MRVELENPSNIRVISVKGNWYITFENGKNATLQLKLNSNHIEYLVEAIADQKRIDEIIKSYANA